MSIDLISLYHRNLICKLKIFVNCTDLEILQALMGCELKTLRHKQVLFQNGENIEHFAILLEGCLKLFQSKPDGNNSIIHFARQGEMVGVMLMQKNLSKFFPMNVTSIGNSSVILVPRKTYELNWAQNISLLTHINEFIFSRLYLLNQEKVMQSASLIKRIAHFMLKFLNTDSENNLQPLMVQLTRQEIADALGVAVESVIRCFREMYKENIVSKCDSNGVELIDVAKVKDLVV